MKDRMMRNNNRPAKHTPFFSVIITTYNRAIILKRALKSLIAQTEKDWEAIIVDDDSNDNTYDQILPFLKKYPQIKYIKHPHQGEAATKNEGILSATGKFITFLDSDDEFDPIHLESRKDLIMSHPDVKLIHGGVKIIGNQFVPDRFDYDKKINLNECIIGGTFFIARELAISLKGFKNILVGADADFFDRAGKKRIKMIKVLTPTYIYHHETEDSITNNILQS